MKVQIQNPKVSFFNKKEVVLNIEDNQLYIVEVEHYMDNIYELKLFGLDYERYGNYLRDYNEIIDFLIIIRNVEDSILSFAFTGI